MDSVKPKVDDPEEQQAHAGLEPILVKVIIICYSIFIIIIIIILSRILY